ncbi:MAG: hypothetical protein JW818_08500 [Pirellulales bacterium]|nr:hypothetical protein [Pirellulales bacterium]
MSDWLDTQTKAILQGGPPLKEAPAGVAAYSLVLLTKPPQLEWFRQAIARVLHNTPESWDDAIRRPCPNVLDSALVLEDAMLGQFELICSGAVSVFLRDEVVIGATGSYLDDLYADLLQSPEFAEVMVSVVSLPPGDPGQRFVEQFLGPDPPSLPTSLRMPRKKARIMEHWATKIGGDVDVSDE